MHIIIIIIIQTTNIFSIFSQSVISSMHTQRVRSSDMQSENRELNQIYQWFQERLWFTHNPNTIILSIEFCSAYRVRGYHLHSVWCLTQSLPSDSYGQTQIYARLAMNISFWQKILANLANWNASVGLIISHILCNKRGSNSNGFQHYECESIQSMKSNAYIVWRYTIHTLVGKHYPSTVERKYFQFLLLLLLLLCVLSSQHFPPASTRVGFVSCTHNRLHQLQKARCRVQMCK